MSLQHLIISALVITLLGCGGNSAPVTSTPSDASTTPTTNTTAPAPPSLGTFTFTTTHNSRLADDVVMQVSGEQITGRSKNDASVTELVATFSVEHGQVYVGDTLQESGVTVNDFTAPVAYKVVGSDGTEVNYTVDLMRFTGLPIIYLNTAGNVSITSKDDYMDGNIRVEGGRSFPSIEQMDMEIRGRGNSTWEHPKKPYQMKLADKEAFLGMAEDKKWLFLAEYSDKTMLRNRMAFELGDLSSLAWTPDSEFAEVYLNGLYNGTYHITQKVEEDGDRVDLGDTGFLLEIDQPERLDADDVSFNTDRYLVNIKEPELVKDDAQYQYISTYVNEFEDTLFGANFADPTTGYAAYINVDSFVDWFLINEITKNVDAQWWSSIFFHVIPGEKINMGPLWDFDLSFGNVDYADSQYAQGWWVRENVWIDRLLDDPAFVARVKTRYAYFKSQQTNLLNQIDDYASYLQFAQAENDAKWQTLGEYVWPNPVVFDTHQQEVNHLKTWFTDRMTWLDGAIPTL
jgi:spore coat protein CotH